MTSVKFFKRQPMTAPGGVEETPYTRARAAWDARSGAAGAQAANWRLAALLSVAALIIALGLLWRAGGAPRVVPYVVEVSRSGEARSIGRVEPVAYEPQAEVVKYFITRWLADIRSISSDPVLTRKTWNRAIGFLTGAASERYTAYARRTDLISHVGKMVVSVEMEAAFAASERAYQVEWVERIFTLQGREDSARRYRGIVQYTLSPPSDLTAIQSNPLGIYISDFNWGAVGDVKAERKS
jgi:type IV secretory pathway TrbF-like protein